MSIRRLGAKMGALAFAFSMVSCGGNGTGNNTGSLIPWSERKLVFDAVIEKE